MNCSFLSGNGYYTLEWLLGCLIAFGMCSGCVRDVFEKSLIIILFSYLFFLTLPRRSAYANKYY